MPLRRKSFTSAAVMAEGAGRGALSSWLFEWECWERELLSFEPIRFRRFEDAELDPVWVRSNETPIGAADATNIALSPSDVIAVPMLEAPSVELIMLDAVSEESAIIAIPVSSTLGLRFVFLRRSARRPLRFSGVIASVISMAGTVSIASAIIGLASVAIAAGGAAIGAAAGGASM